MNVTGEESEQLARGTKWIQMVGELGMVRTSVTAQKKRTRYSRAQ